MFYRIRIDLAFTDEPTARKALEKTIAQLPFAFSINEGQENEEKGYILLEKCYHDENPSIPCDLISLWTPTNP